MNLSTTSANGGESSGRNGGASSGHSIAIDSSRSGSSVGHKMLPSSSFMASGRVEEVDDSHQGEPPYKQNRRTVLADTTNLI
jgi:hypothetical protein